MGILADEIGSPHDLPTVFTDNTSLHLASKAVEVSYCGIPLHQLVYPTKEQVSELINETCMTCAAERAKLHSEWKTIHLS